jgi:hypothetical protein
MKYETVYDYRDISNFKTTSIYTIVNKFNNKPLVKIKPFHLLFHSKIMTELNTYTF